jgi:hypothetical protein
MAIEAPHVGPYRLGAFIGEATFLPGDPPREARFALWRPVPGFAPGGLVRLVVPAQDGVRAKNVPAALVPVSAAIPWLARSHGHGAPSLLAWRAAVRAGLALVARGRLLPSISPAGYDCWRAGPLDDEDEALLQSLAAAFPAEAHAVPLAGDGSRSQSPAAVVRACWDAIADVLPRTAGAATAFGGPLYTDWGPRRAVWLAPSLRDLHGGEEGRGAVQLRVDLPGGSGPRLSPAGLGPLTYDDRVALHRGARRWGPLSRVLSSGATELTEAELAELFQAEHELSPVGVEVALPDLEALKVRAVLGSHADAEDAPILTLDALLDFRWELATGGDPLTAAEVEDLASAQGGLVRLRDRWLTIEPDVVDLLRRRPRQGLRAGEGLAAALTGTIEVGGRALGARVVGPLEALRIRLGEVTGPREEPEPPGLVATLRGYQRRGLAWLRDMCELGFGGCLADDMGLGKTIQVIALHLARGARFMPLPPACR